MSDAPQTASWRARFAQLRRHKVAGFLIDAAFILAIFGAVTAWQTRKLVKSGERVPDVELTDLDGRPHRLSELAGQKVVLTFWAPWCGVCKQETGALSHLQRDGVKVVSVALAYDSAKDVQRFMREQGVDYPVLLGGEAASRAFHIDLFPTTYVLGPDGRIAHAVVGYTTWLGLRARLLF